MIVNSARLFVLPALFALALSTPATAQNIGRTTDDLPVNKGQFAITNTTNAPITYLVRWGNKGFWDKIVLAPGVTETHSYVLDSNLRAPTPYIQFRRWANGKVESKNYKMEFYSVSSGQTGISGSSKPYSFGISDANTVDLFVN
jgi:hypothetical protein